MSEALAPLKLPGFRHLAGAYTVNELGNWVGEIALAVLVFDQTGQSAGDGRAVHRDALPAGVPQPGSRRARGAGRHQGRAARPLPRRGGRRSWRSRSPSSNFSLLLVVGLAIVDGTLAIAARAFTRASAAAVLTPSGQLRQGNAVINVGFTAAGALGPALGGLVVGRPRRRDRPVRGRRVVRRGGRDARAGTIATAGEGHARASVEPLSRRSRVRAPEPPPSAALLAMQAAAFVFFTP